MKAKFHLIYCIAVLVVYIMGSCSSDNDFPDTEEPETTEETEVYVDPGDDVLVPNTQVVNYDNAIAIAFNGDNVTVDNPFSGVTVENSGAHVVIKSTVTDTELYYVLSGITENGSVKIYGEYKYYLVLNGTGITNLTGAAINNQCGKNTRVIVQDETNNRLIDGETYNYTDGEDMKATFFSEGQLNFYGHGSLEIRGRNKHAICVDDYFRMYEGNIVIKEAVSDGIHANDYITIEGGSITSRSVSEGLDCEEGYVLINGGTLDITTSGQKGHGIKSYTTTTVNTDGTVTVKTTGKASKAINSTGDITIKNGTLNLTTTGDAYYDTSEADISSSAAIKGDANLVIDGGTITIKSSGSGGKGINMTGTLTMNGGTVSITTTGDQYKYNSSNDTAAKAMKSDGILTINGGKITISTSKTEAEGIESKSKIYINGGEIEVEAYDDCINASSHIEIIGGSVYCLSATNDGMDSNGTLTVTGGTVLAAGAGSIEDGIDCDNNRFSITGGTIVGVGGSTSSPTTNYCTQRSVIYKSSSSNVGVVNIQSTTGAKSVLTLKLPKTYSSMTLLFSSPDMEASTAYTIYTGGTISGGTNFHGLYTGATYSGGTSASSFTTSSMVTSVGTNGSQGPRGGND